LGGELLLGFAHRPLADQTPAAVGLIALGAGDQLELAQLLGRQ
jgi:hypothetical protein